MKTNRCTMLSLTQTDYHDVKKLYLNDRVREFLGGVMIEEEYDKYFKEMINTKENALYWVIRLNNNNEFIGLVSLDTHHDGISKELSYQFLPTYWGNGYALEVIREILYYAFNELGIQQIVSETQVSNKSSCKLLHNLGMEIINKVYRFDAEQYIFAIDAQ